MPIKKLKHIQEYVMLPSTRFHDAPVRFCINTENNFRFQTTTTTRVTAVTTLNSRWLYPKIGKHIPHDF